MANIFYQKLKCLLSVASNLLLAFVNASLLLHSFLKFAAKTCYVWQGVIVAISWQICDIKIAANLHYVCQGTYMQAYSSQRSMTQRALVVACNVVGGRGTSNDFIGLSSERPMVMHAVKWEKCQIL